MKMNYSYNEMKRAFECGRNFQLTGENNFQELIEELNQALRQPLVSGSASTSCLSTNETTTSATIWKGGWVSDNFSTYYLDENMVKHYR